MEIITNDLIKNNKLYKIVDSSLTFDLVVEKEMTLQLVILPSCENKITFNGKIDVLENASLNFLLIDFNKEDTLVNISSSLASFCNVIYQVAAASYLSSEKIYDISLDVKGIKTNSLVKMNGVLNDNGKMEFLGCSHLIKGCIKSKTRQEGKIIVLSDSAKGEVNPALKIDENDILASHGAALGQVNKETLFYLMSRGLSKKQATSLITVSYLKPFIKQISDVEIEEKLEEFVLKEIQ